MSETQTTNGPLDLEAVKQVLAAATPGSWEWSFCKTGHDEAIAEGKSGAYWDGSLRNEFDPDQEILHVCCARHLMFNPNADLIANAPTWLAALVAEVERLREDRQRWYKAYAEKQGVSMRADAFEFQCEALNDWARKAMAGLLAAGCDDPEVCAGACLIAGGGHAS